MLPKLGHLDSILVLSIRLGSFPTRRTCPSRILVHTPRPTCRAISSHTRPESFFSQTGLGRRAIFKSVAVASFTVSVSLATGWRYSRDVYAEAPSEQYGHERQELGGKRIIRIAELKNHDKDAERPWVARGTSVYDITDWIGGHPGGDIILRAAGGSVEPYWNIFKFHQTQDVYDILEEYRIGSIDPQDLKNGEVLTDSIKDPFADDPTRDPRLQTLTDKPRNAETPASELSEFLTPNKLFYVRNHFWVPPLDEESHRLVVELGDGEEKSYTMADLKTKFKQFRVTATLQCSGNRRKHMNEGAHQTSGLPWGVGAIGNAEWSGPRLRDVLADAGLTLDDPPEYAKHTQFMAAEAYGASIPLHKAIDPCGDVLLACSMNGEPLPKDHGFPVRVLVPGHVAARSVKWVTRIVVSEAESTSQWQRKDYKCFGPNDDMKPNWDMAHSIQEMPVQSAITKVRNGSKSGDDEMVVIEGYAVSGGGRAIVRVDVSTNNGKTWDQATIDEGHRSGSKDWSWKRWRYTAPKNRVGPRLLVKAIDEAYNCQPDNFGPIYNLRGNLSTAWHRVPYDERAST